MSSKLNNPYDVTEEEFNQFQQDMVQLGLIPENRLQSTRHYFINDEDQITRKNSSLRSRFKQKYESLVKRK